MMGDPRCDCEGRPDKPGVHAHDCASALSAGKTITHQVENPRQAFYAITLARVNGEFLAVLGEGTLMVLSGAEMLPDAFTTKPHESLMLSFSRIRPSR